MATPAVRGSGSNRPVADRAQRRRDAGPDLVRVAHRCVCLVAVREVEVGEREVLGLLSPHLDAGEAVELELESGEGSSAAGRGPGLPVHDLPGRLDGRAEDRVDPARDGEALEPQDERALGEQRDLAREPAGEERLAEPVHLARLTRELLGREVGRVLELEQLSLARGAAFDPPMDLGPDPGGGSGEPWERTHVAPVEALGTARVVDHPADRNGPRRSSPRPRVPRRPPARGDGSRGRGDRRPGGPSPRGPRGRALPAASPGRPPRPRLRSRPVAIPRGTRGPTPTGRPDRASPGRSARYPRIGLCSSSMSTPGSHVACFVSITQSFSSRRNGPGLLGAEVLRVPVGAGHVERAARACHRDVGGPRSSYSSCFWRSFLKADRFPS